MKSGLQRIEATLNHLRSLPVASTSGIAMASDSLSIEQTSPSTLNLPPNPLPVKPTPPASLDLPKMYPSELEERRYVADPFLSMNLLKEMEGLVSRWQSELQKILLQIQDIHLEGPVVDGWLESNASDPTVLPLSPMPVEGEAPTAPEVPVSQRALYRLCGLDEKGQFWSRPCSSIEVPYLSLAIARAHKLRQLLQYKQTLESRLSRLAQDLIEVHSRL